MNVERLSFETGGTASMVCAVETSSAIGIERPVPHRVREGRLVALTRAVQRKLASVTNSSDLPEVVLSASINQKPKLQSSGRQSKPAEKSKVPAPARGERIPAANGKRFPDVDEIIDQIDDLINISAEPK